MQVATGKARPPKEAACEVLWGEARLLQIEQQRIAQERRVEASRQKAMEPIKKKTGKPIMFRSAPPQRKEQVEDEQEDDQDELDRQYFFS